MVKMSSDAEPISIKSLAELTEKIGVDQTTVANTKPTPSVKRNRSKDDSISPNNKPPKSRQRGNSQQRGNMGAPKSVIEKRKQLQKELESSSKGKKWLSSCIY